MINKLMAKVELSRSVGWSESNGRRWIKTFKDYIPTVKRETKVFYTNESLSVLKKIKQLSEHGYTMGEIYAIFENQGIPNETLVENLSLNKTTLSQGEFGLESVPSQNELIIAILRVLSDAKPYTSTMLNENVSLLLNLTEEQKNLTYQKSKDSIFLTRMRAARYSLKKQDYIEEVSKLTYQITDEGVELLNDSVEEINEEIEELEKVVNPFEIILDKVMEIEEELVRDLAERLKQVHWRRLETIVVELLTAMGYGDGQVTEKTNDGGLDGIIKEDKLGLDNIYLQAKRWENTVGRPEVMSFSGALDAKGARKGIFITTSSFTKGAEEYVDRLESKKIILLDGQKLAKLMIENNIGVGIKKKLIIKEVDFSYFEGEE
ncbi:restriction endonuclease [Bacillus badius]|uniref:restriction endonuclease n=1 Tax=Bacillus badius TaxID=1455 RepID=UPI0005ADA2EA|nr:restriction endonuclease [Bacillus badius]KIL74378.1 Mrr restriction system protein [Bacillus badius]